MPILRSFLAVGSLLATFVPAVAPSCSPPFEVPDRTYYRLSGAWPDHPPLVNAFVWVDDINSRLFHAGYRPFEVFVIVGKNYAPFSESTGRLNRNDFNAIKGKSANNEFTPWRIDADKPVSRQFTVGPSRFLLTPVSVRNAYLAQNDSITLKVCTE